MPQRSSSGSRLASIALAAIIAACLAPGLAVLVRAVAGLASDGAGKLVEPRHGLLLGRSLLVAGLATGLAVLWGVPVGLVAARSRSLLGRAIERLSYVPLVIPSIVTVIGWIHLAGRTGILARWLEPLGLRLPLDLYTPVGAALVLSLCHFPFVSAVCAQGFRSIDGSMLLAAELEASPLRRLRRIWIPLMFPWVATGSLIVFLLSLSDHGVPSALMVNVYPIEIQAQLSAYPVEGPTRAVILALPPLGIAVLLCGLRHRFTRSAPHPTRGARGPVPRACPHTALAISIVAILLSAILPLSLLVVRAGSFASYPLAARTAGRQILASLEVALQATPILVAMGATFAIAFRAVGPRARAWAETGVLLPLIVPGSVVGLGTIILERWGVPPWSWVRSEPTAISLAAACRFLPIPALILSGALVSMRERMLQAGAVSGAGPVRIARKLVIPLVLSAALAAAAFSFVLSMGELSAAVLVAPPGAMTLAVRLASLLHFGEESVVAALCVMTSGFVIVLLVVTGLLSDRPIRLDLRHEDRA